MKHVVEICWLSLFTRLILILLGSEKWLSERIEITTPLNSITRLYEGVAFERAGLQPYVSDTIHVSPILLWLFKWIVNCPLVIGALFIITDFLIAFCLYAVAKSHHQNDIDLLESKRHNKAVEPLLFNRNDNISQIVLTVYLLNPYTILCCASYSTQCFNQLAVVFGLWMALRGDWFLCGMGLSLCTHLSLYPVMLILPCSLMMYNQGGAKQVVSLLLSFLVWSTVILMLSFYIAGSWDFIYAIYGVILTVPDFTPNVGLFWYFFTEMFDHFRLFFVCVFQINAFIHSVPLTIRFSKSPMFLAYTILSLISIFKSYPTVGDFVLPLSLLPLWSYVFRYLRFTLVICGCVLVSSIAGPILWYLWIHVGSANANFYFGMTIAYNMAQVFLLLDMVTSFMSYNYDLKHGLPRLDKQGKPVLLKLQ